MECLFIVTPDCKSRMSCHAGLQITDERKICQERLRIVEPLQGSIAKAPPHRGDGIPACESSLHVAGRNPGLGKLAHAVGTESQLGKACPRRGEGIPALGKLAHGVGTESQLGKACPRCGDEIPAWESFATPWGRNPGLGKLRHAVGTESQLAKASPRRGEGIAGFISLGSCR